MEQIKIDRLTPEQEAQILVYQQKWQQIVLSTERINRQKAIEAMRVTYALLGEREPDFIFCDSPHSALGSIHIGQTHLGRKIEKKLRKPIQEQLESQISWELIQKIFLKLRPSSIVLEGQVKHSIDQQLNFKKFISSGYWLDTAMLLDFSLSVLNCIYDHKKGDVIQSIIRDCGWILPYSETCILCDRPTYILFKSFDDGEYLHGGREPAIQFTDGFSVYINHGKLEK